MRNSRAISHILYIWGSGESMNTNKTVLVTGAARGIGRAIAIKFAEEEYNVLANYNNSDNMANSLYKSALEKGYKLKVYKADVSKREEVKEMVKYCLSEFKSLDIVINNSGITNIKLFTETSEQEWDTIVNTNLKGTFNVCQEALRQCMINKKEGSIINISSVFGITGGSTEVSYSAAKAGVIGMSKALAKELALSNINVNVIAPGAIATDMLYDNYTEEDLEIVKQEIPMNRFGRVEDIAELAYFLASDNAKYITGQVISPNGGSLV